MEMSIGRSLKDLYWFAGLMEGEGTFCFMNAKRGTRAIRLALAMTDGDVVLRAANFIGYGSCRAYFNRKNKELYPAAKAMYRWECNAIHAAAIMMTIYPLMGERRQQRIRELLAHWRKRRSFPPRRNTPQVFDLPQLTG